jgi:tetratricopeptide (TPR) repeat protein
MRLQVLGDRHFDTAESFHNLGNVRSAQAAYAEAQGYFEQGYAIYQQLSGETPILYIQILCGLACAHRDQGHYDVALRLFEDGIAKVMLYSDEMNVEKAKLFEGLGVLYLQLDSVSVAQTLLDQAHTIYSQTLGDSHPDTAYSLYHLSKLRQAQGDIPAARSTCEQAKRILEQRLGTNHPKTMLVQHHGVSLL